MDFNLDKPIRFYIGNILIIFSLFTLALIYLPLLQLFLPVNRTVLANIGYYINIPKINAAAPIVDNIDPWDERNYQEALTHGVAKARGFASPGENGTIYMFAHSSDFPWRITHYNTIFLRLGELEKGDKIEISKDGKKFFYVVEYKKEIWPNQTQDLKTNKTQLVLQTCTPIGTSLKRLLVFANPI